MGKVDVQMFKPTMADPVKPLEGQGLSELLETTPFRANSGSVFFIHPDVFKFARAENSVGVGLLSKLVTLQSEGSRMHASPFTNNAFVTYNVLGCGYNLLLNDWEHWHVWGPAQGLKTDEAKSARQALERLMQAWSGEKCVDTATMKVCSVQMCFAVQVLIKFLHHCEACKKDGPPC